MRSGGDDENTVSFRVVRMGAFNNYLALRRDNCYMGTSKNSKRINKLEFELRITSYELRSKKFRGHSPASMELFDVQWRAVRLAELTIRNS